MPQPDWDVEVDEDDDEWDEDDVKVRATRRSRPRTKIRPKHEHAQEGFVTAVDRGRYTCLVDDRVVTAMKARELGKQSIVVGDRVGLVGDRSGNAGTLARVVRIEPRHGELRRSADDENATERVVVANVDQLVVVASLIDPPLRYGFVDRCLVAAYDAGVAPVLCLTKHDLAPELVAEARAYYSQLDLTITTTEPEAPLEDLVELLRDKENVFFGHSGVGKSTLVNRLVPGAGRAVSEVRSIGKGSHTSTSTVSFALPGGGWVIDTPGVRSFGLAHVTADSILKAFPELEEVAQDCPRGCTHTPEIGDCALDAAIGPDDPRAGRLASFRRVLASLHEADTKN
ncbi:MULTISPECIES: ribosome small subunit-dependent GTPase A [Glycomyces]|uniref:Small ribosomal subunit biogenesis GTPase RsgA n=2 Tax=Glycomyces TaxID=58113 RepID=A0A9X3PM83_9ACTN|nr:ribosome small subunit-dependent GTPase A [Glycomyces lechevalierae]MDA1387372.1 ribosome small subunit-dependent GTPase A [Glycomyces lechevalierae]MDR7340124.1 ribosome biogenesis GTPase [Glycomyces lechevalierae]